MSHLKNTAAGQFESPLERERRESEGARRREGERARREQLSCARGSYAQLKKDEAERAALLGSISQTSDFRQLALAAIELDTIRRILETFPAEVVEGYRPPESSADRSRRETRERHQAAVSSLTREIANITDHELPGLELKLDTLPTARELGMWARDPNPRERHYQFIREQIAAKRARVEQCGAEIERARAEIDRAGGE